MPALRSVNQEKKKSQSTTCCSSKSFLYIFQKIYSKKIKTIQYDFKQKPKHRQIIFKKLYIHMYVYEHLYFDKYIPTQ